MAGSLFAGAFLGVGLQKLVDVSEKTLSDTVFYDSLCKKLEKTLNSLIPIYNEICNLSSDSQSIQGFQTKLGKGLELVKECKETGVTELVKRFHNAKRMRILEEEISDFICAQLLPIILSSIKASTDHSKNNQLGNLTGLLVKELCVNSRDADESDFPVPVMPEQYMGFDHFLMDLKKHVFDASVNVVGVTGIGGSGKSTLASALCRDSEVKEHFGNRVIYITLSQTPNVENILKTMWKKIVGSETPDFQNVEDAHNKIQSRISKSENEPTLVVLDDVWYQSELENLLFKGNGYKTVVTTRNEDTLPKQNQTQLYRLKSMSKEHALSLFCLWAFGQDTIPETHDEELVDQVLRECPSLPLALKVIGSSLRDKDPPAWRNARNELSRGEVISEYHEGGLLDCLKTSIDVLNEQVKECFLDLGAFPEGQKICANALLDIWVYDRGIEWDKAYVILLELVARNLLELERNPWSSDISYGHTYELYISQHDVIRDLARLLAKQDEKRLYTPQSHSGVPSKWTANTHHESNAQIVSINTGAMDDQQWSQLKFPETEALVLLSTASGYSIPFLHTMQKLKVLIVHNYGSQRAKLNGLDASLKLSQLRSLQLERLILPPLHEYGTTLASLEKLSLSLCEGLGNMSGIDVSRCFNFPKLLQIHIDHCSDLKELPMGLCHFNSLEKLSVTNCHSLQKLPDDLGQLACLQVLKLSACPSLETLPQSIGELKRLEYLDISHCGGLKKFPEGFGGLCKLKTLDMRECSRLKQGYKALAKLTCLKLVVCDKRNEKHLNSIRQAQSKSFTVQVVEEPHTLEWLNPV